jgi:GT2 family glycosyltransferase
VDNGSEDNTISIIEDFKNNAQNINIIPFYLERNMGTTYSRNLALKKAKGDFICIMDSDVEVGKGIFEKLIQVLKKNDEVGLIAPKLVYPDGRPQKSNDNFPTIFTKIWRYFFLKVIERKTLSPSDESSPIPVEYAISAMWMIKRELINNIGLFDENIFYAPEDVDFCLRIWKAGYKVYYYPSISCVHDAQEISRGLKINAASVKHLQGLLYYFKKHGYLFKRPNFTKGTK